MYYSIRHTTRFRYSTAVRESIMEIRMQPRTEGRQNVRTFQLRIQPHSQPFAYSDYLGNAVYHFDVPGEHMELLIVADAMVEVAPEEPLPRSLGADAWQALFEIVDKGEHWDMLRSSPFVAPTDTLDGFIAKSGIEKQEDPLGSLHALMAAVCGNLEYNQEFTTVHSPIDHALKSGKGVCQDFAHIMIAVARSWGIPCRYVSGYLFHRAEDHDQSDPSQSHAWVEAYLPDLGWIGFDPTNNTPAGQRHIRVAIGRDYSDVPPTRGVFKGSAESELAVAVSVKPTEAPAQHDDFLRIVRPMPPEAPTAEQVHGYQQQQQQQQQSKARG